MGSVAPALTAIRAAKTESEVIAAIRNYLATLTEDELALIPAGFKALGLITTDEIARAAVELAQREVLAVGEAPESQLLRDAAAVFSTAAMRLASIALVG
jgi:hypothetical protein